MRTKAFFSAGMALGVLFASSGCAERVDTAAEEAKVRTLIEKTFDAVQNQDWETFAGNISEDWELFTDSGERWDLEAIQQFFKDHISDHEIELSDIEVRVSGDGKMAWAKFDESTQYEFDEQPVSQSAVFTSVFEKTNTSWLCVQLHRSVSTSPTDVGK